MLLLAGAVFYVMGQKFEFANLLAMPTEPRNEITPGVAFDIVIATAFSWIPLAADYNRNCRSQGIAAVGTWVGYVAATLLAMGLGATVSGFSVLTGMEQTYDPAVLLAGFGFGLPAAIVVVALPCSFFEDFFAAVTKDKPFVNEVIPTELKLYIPSDQRIEDWGIPEFERNGVAAWRWLAIADRRGRVGEEYIREAEARGFWIGRPVELPGSRPLRFEFSQDLGGRLLDWPVDHCLKVLFNSPWRPIKKF